MFLFFVVDDFPIVKRNGLGKERLQKDGIWLVFHSRDPQHRECVLQRQPYFCSISIRNRSKLQAQFPEVTLSGERGGGGGGGQRYRNKKDG